MSVIVVTWGEGGTQRGSIRRVIPVAGRPFPLLVRSDGTPFAPSQVPGGVLTVVGLPPVRLLTEAEVMGYRFVWPRPAADGSAPPGEEAEG